MTNSSSSMRRKQVFRHKLATAIALTLLATVGCGSESESPIASNEFFDLVVDNTYWGSVIGTPITHVAIRLNRDMKPNNKLLFKSWSEVAATSELVSAVTFTEVFRYQNRPHVGYSKGYQTWRYLSASINPGREEHLSSPPRMVVEWAETPQEVDPERHNVKWHHLTDHVFEPDAGIPRINENEQVYQNPNE